MNTFKMNNRMIGTKQKLYIMVICSPRLIEYCNLFIVKTVFLGWTILFLAKIIMGVSFLGVLSHLLWTFVMLSDRPVTSLFWFNRFSDVIKIDCLIKSPIVLTNRLWRVFNAFWRADPTLVDFPSVNYGHNTASMLELQTQDKLQVFSIMWE